MTTIKEIAANVHQLAHEKGWYDDNPNEDKFIERTCNNLHNEVSELHEAWRRNELHEFCDKASIMKEKELKPLTCLEEELADIIIRACDSAERLGVDIQSAVERKHAYNSSRSMRHGGKRS